ncbi:MAG: lamin tail domain-containing protein [Marinilabiliaceae bacterium]|nr:lamin tail domain-containing protein [Marinilabiliaceae bacterium]
MNRFFLLLILLPFNTVAQFNESFTDDDIFNNPAWQGSTDWFIINSEQWLQLNAPAEKGEAFLFTPCQVVENATWQINLKMGFNPSSSNLCRIYLIADVALPSQIKNGVFVEVGNKADDVCLYRIDGGKQEKIIDGLDGRVALSSVTLTIRVSRNKDIWQLDVDDGGAWITEGQVESSLAFTSNYFGLYCKYTSTRCDKFFFDDICVTGEAYVDRDKPQVADFALVKGSCLQMLFNEKMSVSNVDPSQFKLNKLHRQPSEVLVQSDSVTVDLLFKPGLDDVVDEIIEVSGLCDLSGNEMNDTSFVFSYERIRIDSIYLENDSTVSVSFNKAIPLKAWEDANVNIHPGDYAYDIFPLGDSEQTMYDLQLNKPLIEAEAFTVSIAGVCDERGDTIRAATDTLWYYHPKRFDVVISELMADPTPSMDLPESEFLELYNRTEYDLVLVDWSLQVNEKRVVLPAFTIAANKHLVLVPKTDQSDWKSYQQVLCVEKWPALTNEKSKVVLWDERGLIMDALDFQRDRVPGEPFKSEGGWSAECIDVDNLSGLVNNWAWSTHLSGGTPGFENSLASQFVDEVRPFIHYVTLVNDSILEIYFSEAMNFTNENEGFGFSEDVPEWQVSQIDTLFLKYLKVQFDRKLLPGQIHQLKTCDLNDLAAHPTHLDEFIRFGAFESAVKNDVIINEVLFNPRPDEVDFVELYNRSSKIISVSQLAFAKWAENKQVTQIFLFLDQNRLLFPGDYLVLTPDSLIMEDAYKCQSPHSILTVDNFPSLPDDEGEVILTDQSGSLIDYFKYRDQMHFDLLKDKEGVSLERLSPDLPGDDIYNWHSAASSVGYATPTYLNSQTLIDSNTEGNFSLEPELFSPNGDGTNDFLTIRMNNKEADGMVSIRIYNSTGQEVCYLVNNQLMAAQSVYTWDGLGEDRQQLMPGVYVVWVRCFYPSGKVVEKKRSCVLKGGHL